MSYSPEFIAEVDAYVQFRDSSIDVSGADYLYALNTLAYGYFTKTLSIYSSTDQPQAVGLYVLHSLLMNQNAGKRVDVVREKEEELELDYSDKTSTKNILQATGYGQELEGIMRKYFISAMRI